MTDIDLRRKGAIVTGGGSGICFAFVQLLHKSGCNVLICDLSLHKDTQLWLNTKSKANHPTAKIEFKKTDVTDWQQLEDTFNAYDTIFGGTPDIVCPGAGVYEPSVNNFWNDYDRHSYKILRINLEHPIKLTRIAIRKFLQRPKPPSSLPPSVLLVSSTGAQKSSIITPLYQAAKHGISNFTRCMGEQLFKLTGIRCVAVAPGPTLSPLFLDHPEAMKFIDPEKDVLCTVDEVARAMMCVLTEIERFAPGTVLEVTHPDKWREVKLLNDPGPGGGSKTAWTSRKDDAIVDVIREIERDKAGLHH